MTTPGGIWIPEHVRRDIENPKPVPAVFEWRGTMTVLTEERTPMLEQPDGQWIPHPMAPGHVGLRVGYRMPDGEIKPVGVVQEDGNIAYYDEQA